MERCSQYMIPPARQQHRWQTEQRRAIPTAKGERTKAKEEKERLEKACIFVDRMRFFQASVPELNVLGSPFLATSRYEQVPIKGCPFRRLIAQPRPRTDQLAYKQLSGWICWLR